MDDHNFFCVLLCSACSTTCCCIAVWTIESNSDFLRPICRIRLCLSGLGISRQTGFNLEFPSPRWIACQGYEIHPPFFRFCLETYKLLGELSAMTGFNLEFPSPRWIACQGYEIHPPFFRFCLETYKLLGELSAMTMSFPCPASFVKRLAYS